MQKEKLEMIPLTKIRADQKKNPRKKEDKTALEELMRSIKDKGVVVPVIVYPTNGTYELVCGFRRLKAVQQLKLTAIPAIIRGDLDEKGAAEIRTIENLQREDLDILDEAAGFKKLLTEFDWRVEDIAERVGKSEGYIRKRLAILKSPDYIRRAVVENRITLGHAMLLNTLQDEGERKKMLQNTGYGRWSIKELYRQISDNDRKINKNTLFDTTKCQGCKWLGLKQKQLPLEDVGKTLKGQDICFNKACYTQKMQEAFQKKVEELNKGELKVEILEPARSINWRWENFAKHRKGELVDPEKCKACPDHVMIVDKNWRGGFAVQDTCKKGGCRNWKANLKASQETKKEREKKKKEREGLAAMVEEVLQKIDKDKVNFLLIKHLISGGYGAMSAADKGFAKIFAIETKNFPKYDWGRLLLAQLSKRHPKHYPEMIKTYLILDIRYRREGDFKALHREIVKPSLKKRIRKEMVTSEKKKAKSYRGGKGRAAPRLPRNQRSDKRK